VTIHVVALWRLHHKFMYPPQFGLVEESWCGSNMFENVFQKQIMNFDNCIGICNLYK
jgi:hypothetical protein